jgi:hypothetical protein
MNSNLDLLQPGTPLPMIRGRRCTPPLLPLVRRVHISVRRLRRLICSSRNASSSFGRAGHSRRLAENDRASPPPRLPLSHVAELLHRSSLTLERADHQRRTTVRRPALGLFRPMFVCHVASFAELVKLVLLVAQFPKETGYYFQRVTDASIQRSGRGFDSLSNTARGGKTRYSQCGMGGWG